MKSLFTLTAGVGNDELSSFPLIGLLSNKYFKIDSAAAEYLLLEFQKKVIKIASRWGLTECYLLQEKILKENREYEVISTLYSLPNNHFKALLADQQIAS